MKKIIILVVISLSIQLLNASCINDGLSWSERIFKKDYWSAIFTCKVLDNIAQTKEYEEFGKIYTELTGYCIIVQVEKVFYGKVDTGIVNINKRYAMEQGKTYLVYARHGNPKGNYFYLSESGCDICRYKEITNEKNVIREVEILSELSNIVNNKLTCNYVMLDADNNRLVKGFFKNGKRVKKWKHYWSDAGNIKAEYDFSNNSITQYDKNGVKKYKKITSEKNYGQLVNNFWYYDNGKLREQYSSKELGFDKWGYNTAIRMDYQIEYYENGKIKAKKEFLNSDSVGIWYFYDEKGKYKEKKIYKNIDTLELMAIEKEKIERNKLLKLPTSSIYGKLTDNKTGKPISGSIYLYREGRNDFTTSDITWDGIYYIKEVPIGNYELKINAGNYYDTIKKEVEIKENEDIELDFQIQLLPTSSIYGKIMDKKTGKPLDGPCMSISLYYFRDGDWNSITSRGYREMPNGIYHIKDIPIGNYKVIVQDNCCRYYIPKEVEIKENEDAELDFQLD